MTKKILFLQFALLLALNCAAQHTAYIKVASKGAFDKIERVSTGGFITTGFDSVYKLQIIRWDEYWNPVWKYKFTDSRITPFFPRVAEANDGNFYFMASSTEYTGCTYIAKFSNTGTMLWQKIYYLASDNMNSMTLSKAVSGDNGFLFGGGQCALSNFVIKCNANGDIEWQKSYHYPLASGVITCWSIIPDGNNYVVSSGYNTNSLLTIKLDASGNALAHTAYTYSGMQIIPTRLVKLNHTGGYALLGHYNNSNDNKTQFVAIYNSALNLLTYNELTVTYTQFTLEDITAVNNGKNVVVNGSIYDNSKFTQVLINMTANGDVVWKKRAGGNSGGYNTNVEFKGITRNGDFTVSVGHGYNEGCVAGIIDSNGNGLCNDVAFALTDVNRTLTLQSSTLIPMATNALVSVANYVYGAEVTTTKHTYCGTLGIEDHQELSTLLLYPNPANNMIYLEGLTDMPLQIDIYSLMGQRVASRMISTAGAGIYLGDIASGYYLMQITEKNGRRNKTLLPFIKE
jgi:hypothetical protein